MMDFFPSPDLNRHAQLVQLQPIDAARALFDGAFYPNDEPALTFALRKDPRITLDDEALIDLAFDAMDQGLDAEAFLELAATRS